MSRFVALVAFALCSPLVVADIPSHCLHGDVLGTWEIHSGVWRPCSAGNEGVVDALCGYTFPDQPKKHSEWAWAGIVN